MNSKQFSELAQTMSWIGGMVRVNEYRYRVDRERLPELAHRLNGQAILLAMFAADHRFAGEGYRVYLVFGLDAGELLTIVSGIPANSLVYPSITPHLPAAHWYEREIADMFGIQVLGHPDPRRLVLHRGWPIGYHPMRKDFQAPQFDAGVALEGNFPYQQVLGEGVSQVPVGPIHAGIIEPGHFRFHVVGESVLELDARLFYTHRGIEKMAEGRTWQELLPLTERICGVCTVSHSYAYALALEKLAGVTVTQRANYLRLIYAELERIYNHLNDISAICAGVGLALGTQRGAELKEAALVLNRRLTGHRYLRGSIVPGGVGCDLDPTAQIELEAFTQQIAVAVSVLWDSVSGSDAFLDRMQTTGILTPENAEALGAVGPAARASGLKRDTRVDFSYGAYRNLKPAVATEQAGDVYARFAIRFAEIQNSLELIREALAQLPEGELGSVLPPELPANQEAFGVVESARGSDLHWVATDGQGRIGRYVVRSASYPNWPALVTAVPGNIIPDFPLINKSFELCYACLDR